MKEGRQGLVRRLLALVMFCFHLGLGLTWDQPEWVMFKRAPVAFRWTLISLDRARRVNGPNEVDRAILFLFSSIVRRG
jgi:hypothetical protein